MYAAASDAYRTYGATFVGWGGANTPEQVKRHHDLGIRCTASMWCLTAGARRLHENKEFLAAACVDIEGKPVEVPWLFDHTYKGMKTYFGCTNHPAFRGHNRDMVRKVMAGGADGLHIDDHLGTAQSAMNFGGGLCDHCIAAFRAYLKKHAAAKELQAAGVADLKTFDYRDLIRKHAKTRRQYRKVQNRIPLMAHFKQFHLEAAAENVRQLGELAANVAGHPVLLSANAGVSYPPHRHVLKYLTHVICEVPQHASAGTKNVASAVEAYRIATEANRPLAATASGHDWAFAKANKTEDLVRFWIALAYAHGQRFMVPHPKRQWCFSRKLGTHWYAAPIEAFAPVYQFIRKNAACFDSLEAVALKGFTPPPNTLCTVRRRGKTGRTVIHVINRDYDAKAKAMRPQKNVTLRLPKSLLGSVPKQARLLSYDAAPRAAAVKTEGGNLIIDLPTLRLWTLVVAE